MERQKPYFMWDLDSEFPQENGSKIIVAARFIRKSDNSPHYILWRETEGKISSIDIIVPQTLITAKYYKLEGHSIAPEKLEEE